jgi:hypothetical protein
MRGRNVSIQSTLAKRMKRGTIVTGTGMKIDATTT